MNSLLTEDFALEGVNGVQMSHELRKIMRRAMEMTRANRFTFDLRFKGERRSGGLDPVTSIDVLVQEVIDLALLAHWPRIGVQAEESTERSRSRPCTIPGRDAFFTIDPIDGTSAFVRMQSHGFGPMLALVVDGRIEGAYVGDAMTNELFFKLPGSNAVFHIDGHCARRLDRLDRSKPLADFRVQLRDAPEDYSPFMRRLVRSKKSRGGYFAGIDVVNGGIGLGMAKLWVGEDGLAIIHPGVWPAHDWLPVIGISQALGFAFIRIDAASSGVAFERFQPEAKREPHIERSEVVIVHQRHIRELRSWIDANLSG